MIIQRYLIREISKPLAAVLGILIVLFASYSAASILSDAVNALLPTDTIAELVGLKVLISLEVLIPVSLYLSVVLSFSGLYGDSEFTAMFALGVTPAKRMRAVLTLSGYLALAVATLSLVVRPWAYQKLHELSDHAEASLNVNAMEAGTFYVGQNGNRVIFITRRDGPRAPAQDVFVQLRDSDGTKIIYAPLAQTAPKSGSEIHLSNARIYEISNGSGQDDQVLDAQEFTVDPNSPSGAPPAYSSVAASSIRLATSDSPQDIAEFQWRLSTPLSTLLLGMMGIPLSRTKLRQAKYAKFGTAIFIYSGYYLLCTAARTWVQHGMIAKFPGIWWAPALLALLLLVTLNSPNLNLKLLRRRA